ncbi:DUF5801 domain-containing protein [Sphingomonas sp. RB56-2]|uniref:DUF5801 domain-containing protein n=1 Tax=Sphingomonas brevis TaxID=2908206 RepID=A0ABT0SC18_9SPHN|nr:DUF5801 repeats-in-toxin domain-containing protein [Sphingomonas brevis]MCL6741878.1 DUF5801 domain-containing protein [Sphingomonas brevis]
MRYEDASHTGAFQGQGPVANDDTDQLAAGSKSSATGNLISGEGTQTGSTGADVATGGHITAIAGKGGEDSSFAGGKLSVLGEYGKLSVDAEGNYVYQANKGVENVRDRFTYTLADNNGASDTASLVVEIGKTPLAIKADAQQIVVGPDGVVTLPAGVELSDVHVVGRNLVVDMPDGTQLIILDGAIFVPQLVLGGVEVPSTNVAALLIGQEVAPAAGENVPSSGGNFAVPPPPLDPGVPLGDLIPPTEYNYIPPEPQEVFDIDDEEPEAGAAFAVLDDDAQEGGIAGGVGDDAGSNFFSGSLPGSGGDGNLTWDLQASGSLPDASFSYVEQPNGDIWILQNAVHVITVSVNPATGAYEVEQLQALDHPAGGDENNLIFTLNYSVTDEDGDTAGGTLTINVDDDTPTVDVAVASDANVVLLTQDAETDGDPTDTDTDSTSADFGGIFSHSSAFGADGPGTANFSYALSTTGGASNLSSHGAAINLYNVGGVIVGSTAATAGAVNASNTIFDISVDSGTGVVTLNQYAQIDHPIAADPTPPGPGYEDQLATLADGAVTLTQTGTVTDGDGDTVTDTASVGIGANIKFADDGPSIRPSLHEVGAAVLDETLPSDSPAIPLVGGVTAGNDPDLAGGLAIGKGSTSDSVVDANAAFGADGPANGGGISYDLVVLSSVSGLTTTEGTAINLVELSNGVVVGIVDGTQTAAFAIQIDSTTGIVTVEQYLSLFHPDATDADDIDFLAEGSLGVTVTATDFDQDHVTSEPVDITSLIQFHDDGPSVSLSGEGEPTLIVDETNLGGDAGPTSFAGLFNFDFGADGPASSDSIQFNLGFNPGSTGLVDSQSGLPVVLSLESGEVVGRAGVGGEIVFTISVNAAGGVSLDQARAVIHADPNDPNDDITFSDDNLITLSATITDGDGDQASIGTPIAIAQDFHFLDDAPDAQVDLQATLDTLVVDETRPVGQETDGDSNPAGLVSATANFADNFVAPIDYGNDGPGNTAYSLSLSGANVHSGIYALDASDTTTLDGDGIGQGDEILLNVNGPGTLITGAVNGTTYFTIAINPATGLVTFTQVNNVWHGNTGNDDDTSTLNATAGSVKVNQTVTDADGDHDTASVDVSQGVFQIEDDGPNAAVNPQAALDTLVLDETRPVGQETDGDSNPAGLATTTANFADNFMAPVSYGTDGAGSTVYSLVLNGSNVASGLYALDPSDTSAVGDGIGQGDQILLNINGAGTLITGAVNGTTYFTISINQSTGVVTFTQVNNIWHSNTGNDDDTSTLNASAGSVLVQQTVTDADGDHDSATVDVSAGVFQIEDDGPNAQVNTGAPADTLVLDETRPVGQETDGDSNPAGLGTVTASFADNFVGAGVYGTDGPGNTAYSLVLNGSNVASGLYALDPTDTSAVGDGIGQGDQILLNINGAGTLITGAVNGTTYFTIAIDPATGVVTFTQVNNVWHSNTGNDDDTSTLNAGTGSVLVQQTITDADGDHDSASIDVSAGVFQIEDDGPDASVNNAVPVDTLVLDESRPIGQDPVGDNAPAGLATITANFADNFNGPAHYGTDGAGNTAYSLSLSGPNVNSGLYALDPTDTSAVGDGIGQGSQILLNINGAGTLITGAVNGTTYFTIAIDPATGVVTFTQVNNIWHPNTASGDDTATLTALANSVLVNQTVTDADGDHDTASIDVSTGVFQVEDSGPTAQNDTDSILGGNGPATGNVITGIEVAVAEDANNQDGVADSVGTDSPGRISHIDHASSPDVDVPAGGSVQILGDHGTLTIYSNGDYSYLRTDNVGGVSDTFTYTLMDADGDTVTATLTIGIQDNFPNLADPDLIRLDDDVIPAKGGNLDGPGDDDPDTVPGNVVNGQLNGTGGDGDLDYSFTGVNTLPTGFTIGAASDADTLLIVQQQNGSPVTVMTIQLDLETGAFSVTQNNPILHDPTNPGAGAGQSGNFEDNLTFSIGVQVNDADNDVEPATITINVDDDTPTINVTQTGESSVLLTTDDAQTIGANSDTAVTVSGNFAGVFGLTQSAGADGTNTPATLGFALGVSAPGVDSLLNSHGADIHLFLIAGKVVGSTAASAGLVDAGNTIFDVSVDSGGIVTLTQYQQIDHAVENPSGPPFNDQLATQMVDSLITLTASATLTDKDGDTVTDSEVANIAANLRFTDDGPDAALSATAVGSVTLDETRAEGTDTTGGTLPNGDASATIDFSVNFVNGASVNYGADGAGSTVYKLALTGSNVNSGLYALDGTDTETVIDGYGQGSQIVLNINGAGTLITGAVNGTTYFTIAIDTATGVVTFTQVNNIWHPVAGTTGAALDDLATLNTATADLMKVIQTVTDFDGDTDTAEINIGRGVFNIQDDGPRTFDPEAIGTGELFNEAGSSATADLDVDANINNNVGTDTPGLVQFANIVNGDDSGFTSGGDEIDYWLSNNGQTLQGRTNSTNGTDGELVFTVQLNQGAGTYTVTMEGTIDNGAGVSFDNLTSSKAGNLDVRAVGDLDPNNPVDLILTASASGNNATINTSSSTVGAANQSMDQGETVRIDFVENAVANAAKANGFSYDGHIGTKEYIQLIPQVQGSQTETVAFRVYALNTSNADTAVIDDTPVGANPAFSDASTVAITTVTIDGYNDGPDDGTPNEPAVTVALGPVNTWTTVAYGVYARLESDGSVTFTGVQEGDRYGISTGTDFNALAVTSLATGIGPAGHLSTTNSFDLGVFAIGQVDTGDPINLAFDLKLTDADGDSVVVTDALQIQIDPAADAPGFAATSFSTMDAKTISGDSFSNLSFTSNDNGKLGGLGGNGNGFGNGNNLGVTSAMVAASGFAAMSTTALHSFDQPTLANMAHEQFQLSSTRFSGREDFSGSQISAKSFGHETMQLVNDVAPATSGHSFTASQSGGHALDVASAIHTAPTFNMNVVADHGPAMHGAGAMPIAPTVAMVSAQALQAANLAGHGEHDSSTAGKIVAEVLAQGNAPAVVDAVLNAIHGGNGGDAALVTLASHAGTNVPAWDMAMQGAFGPGSDMMMKMGAEMLHHDAVQPAHNG